MALSEKILLSAARGGGIVPSRDEGIASVCRRTTHVSLERKNLSSLHGVFVFTNAKALFAYENRLTGSILNIFGSGLHGLQNLHSLYLENNQISFLAGIEALSSLKKLYLQGNAISLVSSHLGELTQLTDLNLSGQKNSSGLVFEPGAIIGLAKSNSLQLLDISSNTITPKTLGQLMPLRSLKIFLATDNSIDNLSVTIGFLCRQSNLERVDVRRNPITHSKVTGAGLAYQKMIIEAIAHSCPYFCWLDGRDVEERYRLFAAELRHRKGDKIWSAGIVSLSTKKTPTSAVSFHIENVLVPPTHSGKSNLLPSLNIHSNIKSTSVHHIQSNLSDASSSSSSSSSLSSSMSKKGDDDTIVNTNKVSSVNLKTTNEILLNDVDDAEELGPTADDEIRVGRDDMTPLRPNMRSDISESVDELGNTLKTPRGRPGPLAMAPLPMRTPLPPIESALSLITETSDENATATGLPSVVGSAAATMVAGSVFAGEDREKLERALASVSNQIRETDEADDEDDDEEEEDDEEEHDGKIIDQKDQDERFAFKHNIDPISHLPASAILSSNTNTNTISNSMQYRAPNQSFRPGSRSELRSKRPVRSEFAEVYIPLRTPSDFKRKSRFINSRYVTSEVRLEAEKVAAGRIFDKVASTIDSKVSDREMRHHIVTAAAGDDKSISPKTKDSSPKSINGQKTIKNSKRNDHQIISLGEPTRRATDAASRFFLKPVETRKTKPSAPESDMIDFGGALALHLLLNRADPHLLGIGKLKTLSPRKKLQPILITGLKSRK